MSSASISFNTRGLSTAPLKSIDLCTCGDFCMKNLTLPLILIHKTKNLMLLSPLTVGYLDDFKGNEYDP
jgi:hypothetical protein